MATDELQLVEPSERLQAAFLDFMDDYRRAGEVFREGDTGEIRRDFAGFLRRIRNQAASLDLPDGHVPASRWWLVRGGRVIGSVSFRHRLTESLRDHGGHIGYGVRPSERGKGCAAAMLAMTLEKVRAFGLRRVLVTCLADNPASARVIEKCGGVLDSEGISRANGQVMRRYWINLASD